MDLVRLEDGRIFNEGDGNAATNAWEAPLFAPIAGTVVQSGETWKTWDSIS